MADAPPTSRPKAKQPAQGENPKPGSTQTRAAAAQRAETHSSAEQASSSKMQEQQPQQRPEPAQPQRQFEGGVAQGCIDLVESYRRGGRKRGEVILLLAKLLRVDGTDDDDPAASEALDTYCAQVNEIDATRKGQESRPGSHERRSANGEPRETSRRRGRSRTLRQSKGKKRAERSESRSRSRSSRQSNSRSVSPLDLSDDEPSAAKRQKPDASLFVWAETSKIAEKKLRPEVLQTLNMLRRYAVDIRFAKSDLINSVGAPEFPDAEWGNVLRGKPVDLNHVFSGQYTLGQDEKHVEKLGPVELSYRAVTPAKVVRSAGDWVIAWQRASAAIAYAFPHRKSELESYHNHIFGFFGAVHSDYHHRILDYDRAVRKKVAAMRTILLTDVSEFGNLRTLHIDSIGASAATGYPGKRRDTTSRKPSSDEPCKRWNRGQCNASDAACKFAHRCSTCDASGHPATGCPKDGKHK